MPAVSRSNSSGGGKAIGPRSPTKESTAALSRFTTLPSATSTPAVDSPPPPPSVPVEPETQFHLPPDYLASLLSGGNSPATLEALFQLQNGGGLTPSAASAGGPAASTSSYPFSNATGPTPDFSGLSANGSSYASASPNDYFHRALLPSPKPAAQVPPTPNASFPVNPLEGLISPSTLSTIFPTNACGDSLQASYGQQLEQQTRDQLMGSGGTGTATPLEGAPWDPNQALSDADLEALMAQFSASSFFPSFPGLYSNFPS